MINFYILSYMVQAVIAGVDSGEPILVTKFERASTGGICADLQRRPLTLNDKSVLRDFGHVTYASVPKIEFRVVSEPKCEAR